MAPEGMSQIERVAAQAPRVAAPSRVASRPDPAESGNASLRLASLIAERHARTEPGFGDLVEQDVQTLAMSTLSFQDYVRERMLKRRQAEINGQPDPLGAEFGSREMRPAPESVPSLTAARQQRAQAAMQAMSNRRAEPEAAPARVAW